MDTKPYSLQSPEEIAKDYGGNKQKIAQAMQLGVVDPTAGVLAGMFIDRMRAAQTQEQAPQATVAQQVMGGAPAQAPLAQAGGLGATAPASPPMAPQGGAPMAPPPMQAAPPMQGPPPGMAAGGVFEAPYMAGGGLSELPLPDTMFDEDRNGGYAGGGIVAFAEAGAVRAPARPSIWGGSIMEAVPGAYEEAEEFYAKYMPERKNTGLNLMEAAANKILDPAEQKKQAKQDKWMTLAEIGFNMASSNSPYLLQAVGASAAAALPGAKQAKKEREAQKREAIRDLAIVEDTTYKQAMDKANYIRGVAKDKLDLKDRDIGRKFQQEQTIFQEGAATGRTAMQIQGQKDVAGINAKSYQDYGDRQNAQLVRQAKMKAPELAQAAALQDRNYQKAMNSGDKATAQAIVKDYTRFYRGQMGIAPYLEGDRGKDAKGRPIVFKNDQWVYPS